MYRAEFRYREATLALTAQPDGKGWRVVLPDGTERTVARAEVVGDRVVLHTDTGCVALAFARTAQGLEIQYRGRVYRFQRVEAFTGDAPAHSSAEGALTAPMPGLVSKVFVQQGERVETGQRLLVLEAMKTEQALRAPFAGVVARLNTQEGDLVQEGAVLIVLEESLDSDAGTRKPLLKVPPACRGNPTGAVPLAKRKEGQR